ncbi:MAG: hypothetical protein AAFQ36_00650 [Pseudomonadota bacterium]
MTGSELQIIITLGLIGAMLLGWILRWIWGSFAVASTASVDTIEELQNRTAEAEENAAEAQASLLTAQSDMEQKLREKDAELEATMEALRASRQTAAQWQAAYEAAQRSTTG